MSNPTKYAVIFQGVERTGYSAYVPDLPGCIATGNTIAVTRERMRGAIKFHLRAMREDGDPVPEPTDIAAFELLEVA